MHNIQEEGIIRPGNNYGNSQHFISMLQAQNKEQRRYLISQAGSGFDWNSQDETVCIFSIILIAHSLF